jgi:undecaprenyl diphosphate synthase
MMNPIPNHIAIIMDGNGRWANNNGFPRIEGHRKGARVVEEITEVCQDLGVKCLTLYAFSDENWSRPSEEVKSLMQLLSFFVKAKCEKMISNGIKFNTIGDVSKLPNDVLSAINEVKAATAGCTKMTLVLALSYGSHSEISRAVNKLIQMGKETVTPEDIEEHLDTAGMPPLDLFIRTSGEYRLSNFLLWQLSYAELWFTQVLWPDFNKESLLEAIEDYRGRERRFGRVIKEG